MVKKHIASKDKGKGPAREPSPSPPPTKRPRSSGIRIGDPPIQTRSIPPRREVWDFLDLDSRTRGKNLRGREYLETKTIDFNALEKFGIQREIEGYLANLSWNNFVKPRYPGYKSLTLEFLSSLVLHKHDDELGYYGITFSLFGKPQAMTKSKLDECFGFSTSGIKSFQESEMDIRAVWEEIGTTPRFRPSHTQAKHFKTFSHFVLHKIICNSVFAKKDGNDKVSQKELLFLHCAIHNKEIQTGYFFLDHLIHLQVSKSGAIMVGSFISKIAAFLKFDLERPQAYPLNNPLTILNGLMDMEFFVKKVGIVQQQGDGTFRFLGGLSDDELRRVQEERRQAQEEERAQRARSREPQTQEASSSTMNEILASLKRLEVHYENQEATNQKLLGLIHDNSIELDCLHADLRDIRAKLELEECDHDNTSSSSDAES